MTWQPKAGQLKDDETIHAAYTSKLTAIGGCSGRPWGSRRRCGGLTGQQGSAGA
jgi:hypothetical protein